MTYKSQNNEAEIVINYFNNLEGDFCILSIGENDGVTLSNTYDLLNTKDNFTAHLIEPSPKAFERLSKVYLNNDKIKIHNIGIAETTGIKAFYESGNHLGNDVALLSSLSEKETHKWHNTEFNLVDANFMTFDDFLNANQIPKNKTFDFITIDAEGFDLSILLQIDLYRHGCKILCIEHNGFKELISKFTQYAEYHGMEVLSINSENILFKKKQTN